MSTHADRSIAFAEGRVFTNAPAGEVQDYLASRSLERMKMDSSRLRVDVDGPRLVLSASGGQVRQFPMRRSCFDKLLRWHEIPSSPVARMGAETAAHLLNGVLRLIDKEVCVRVENGDALTVTSTDYSEISDSTVLAQCHAISGAASRVTRTDHFLRINYDNRMKIEPAVGDVCGLGVEVANSETGFMALQVSASIYRLVCKNGAVAPRGVYGTSMIHYRVGSVALESHLREGVRKAESCYSTLAAHLSRSTNEPHGDLHAVARRLDGIIGPGRGKAMVERFERQRASASRYELFNFITRAAQDHDPWFRLRLESYAGELLLESDEQGRRGQGTRGMGSADTDAIPGAPDSPTASVTVNAKTTPPLAAPSRDLAPGSNGSLR